MENFWTDTKSWKNTIITSVICIAICIICELSILNTIELYINVSGIESMIYAFIIATVCSAFLQTLYIKAKNKNTFIGTFKKVFSMVACSMIGMFLADLIFHTIHLQKNNIKHHHHKFVQDLDKTPMYDMMTTPIAITIMVIGGLVFLLPYNYYYFKKYGNHC